MQALSVSDQDVAVQDAADLDPDAPIQVRDLRTSRWFWLDEALIDTFGPLIGPTALTIYATLAAMAGRESQKCWPTVRALAAHWSLGLATVLRAITTLEWWGLLRVERSQTGMRERNTYMLLQPLPLREAVAHYLRAAAAELVPGAGGADRTDPAPADSMPLCPRGLSAAAEALRAALPARFAPLRARRSELDPDRWIALVDEVLAEMLDSAPLDRRDRVSQPETRVSQPETRVSRPETRVSRSETRVLGRETRCFPAGNGTKPKNQIQLNQRYQEPGQQQPTALPAAAGSPPSPAIDSTDAEPAGPARAAREEEPCLPNPSAPERSALLTLAPEEVAGYPLGGDEVLVPVAGGRVAVLSLEALASRQLEAGSADGRPAEPEYYLSTAEYLGEGGDEYTPEEEGKLERLRQVRARLAATWSELGGFSPADALRRYFAESLAAAYEAEVEPARLRAWLAATHARAHDLRNPAGYLRRGLDSGEWPPPAPKTDRRSRGSR